MTSLKLDLKIGESVDFNNGLISITLLEKSGRLARLDIVSDESVKIKHSKLEASSMARNGLTVAA